MKFNSSTLSQFGFLFPVFVFAAVKFPVLKVSLEKEVTLQQMRV